jgi:hypothetical protein
MPPPAYLARLLDFALPAADPVCKRHRAEATEMAASLAPTDAAEQMLVCHMITNHFRAIRLARNAFQQTNIKWFQTYQSQAAEAMNLYRRQLRALADYRRPPRKSFAAIRHANIAGQQVVITQPGPNPTPPPPPLSPSPKARHEPVSLQDQTQAQISPDQDRPISPADVDPVE